MFSGTVVPGQCPSMFWQEQLEEDKVIESKVKDGELAFGESASAASGRKPPVPVPVEDGESDSDDAVGDDDNDDENRPNVEAAIDALTAKQQAKRAKKILKKKSTCEKKTKKKSSTFSKQSEEPQQATLGLDEAVDFTSTIATKTVPAESRTKHALDDFLMSVHFSRRNLTVKISEAEAVRSKSFLTSFFLELAWTGAVAINGKAFKTYSAFREECQRVFVAAHRKLQVGHKEFDPLALATHLMVIADAPVSCMHCLSSHVVEYEWKDWKDGTEPLDGEWLVDTLWT